MTKKQFISFALTHNCSAHYSGNTQTMYLFGSSKNLSRIFSKGGNLLLPSNLPYKVKLQATN